MTEKSFKDLPIGDAHLREELLSGEDIYGGIFLNMKRDQVSLPDGNQAVREYLTHPGAVAILAILDDGRVLMERQYRYPIAKACIEIPAGKLEIGEDRLLCAQRELEEETGYSASKWSFIRRIHPVISYSTERIEIFLAQGLTQQAARLDEEEFLEVFTLALPTAMDWVRSGRITDAKTICGLLWAEKIGNGAWK